MLKIALTGLPGAGKSTTSRLLDSAFAQSGRVCRTVKIAAPLYDLQAHFYDRLGHKISAEQQDGILLNFLGKHFRDIESDFLTDDMNARVDLASIVGADVVVCDDARPADLSALRDQGFKLVRIETSDDLRTKRKLGRNDLSVGRDDHVTERSEAGAAVVPDFVIENSGTIEELVEKVERLVASVSTTAVHENDENDLQYALRALFDKARALVSSRYGENRHQIAAAVLTKNGRIFTGLHVEAMVGRASVCAEAIALGKACEAGENEIVLAIAVRHPKPSESDRSIRVVPPCGLCRELLLDYGRHARAIVADQGALRCVPIAEMLPHKYIGSKWNNVTSP